MVCGGGFWRGCLWLEVFGWFEGGGEFLSGSWGVWQVFVGRLWGVWKRVFIGLFGGNGIAREGLRFGGVVVTFEV